MTIVVFLLLGSTLFYAYQANRYLCKCSNLRCGLIELAYWKRLGKTLESVQDKAQQLLDDNKI